MSKKEELQENWMDEESEEGQLAIDAFQDEENIYLKAPIAGVNTEDLEISITDEVVSIKGQRKNETVVERQNYFVQECYWGSFSRSYILPISVDASKSEALLRNGILTIKIPKQEKTKTKILKVQIG